MQIMVAFDNSRNAKLALTQVISMFRKLEPIILLVSVVENPGASSDANDALFDQEKEELKAGIDKALDFCKKEGLVAQAIMAEGDARKMILSATKKHSPDMLVVARHSHQPDAGFIAKSLTYFIDEVDYMTFGSVSAFLARRVECPLLILPS